MNDRRIINYALNRDLRSVNFQLTTIQFPRGFVAQVTLVSLEHETRLSGPIRLF